VTSELLRKKPTAYAVRGMTLLLLPLASAGCGSNVGDISGKVTYLKKELPAGTVMVMASDGKPYSAQIQPDGMFTIKGVPVGAGKVSVTSVEAPAPAAKTSKPGERVGRLPTADVATGAEPKSRIPEYYGDFNQSGLTVTVQSGLTPLNLDLK
jgi:hypothetical protein